MTIWTLTQTYATTQDGQFLLVLYPEGYFHLQQIIVLYVSDIYEMLVTAKESNSTYEEEARILQIPHKAHQPNYTHL